MARRKMSTVATVSFVRTSTVSFTVNFTSCQRRRKQGSRLSTKLTVKYDSLGHPMDLFLKISVLQADFCWLGDLDKIICPWKESDAGKLENCGCLR